MDGLPSNHRLAEREIESGVSGGADMSEPKEPFIVHCGKCSHEWAAAFLPMPINLFAKLAKALCPMCGSKQVLIGPLPKDTAEGDALAWIANGDTGISSQTIWAVLMGRQADPRHAYDNTPRDPDDFGRCYRLLKVMPSWRVRLPEVASKYPKWAGLVAHWEELTSLYEEELPTRSAPKLYARMQQLRENAAA